MTKTNLFFEPGERVRVTDIARSLDPLLSVGQEFIIKADMQNGIVSVRVPFGTPARRIPRWRLSRIGTAPLGMAQEAATR